MEALNRQQEPADLVARYLPYPRGFFTDLGFGFETATLDERSWDRATIDPAAIESAWDGTIGSILPASASLPRCIDLVLIGDVPSRDEILAQFGWDSRFAKMICLAVPRGGVVQQRGEQRFLEELGYRLVYQGEAAQYFLIGASELAPAAAKQPVDVFVEYFSFGVPARDAEIEEAFLENLESDAVGKLFFVCWDDRPPPRLHNAQKCQLIELEKRPTIQQIIAIADETSRARVKVLCNSDIQLSEDFVRLQRWLGNGEFYSLVRTEDDGRFNPRHGYDCWCWAERCKITGADFELGRLNCDMRLNQLGYEVYGDGLSCPSESFINYHVHASLLRPGSSNLARRSQGKVDGAIRQVPIRAHPFDRSDSTLS